MPTRTPGDWHVESEGCLRVCNGDGALVVEVCDVSWGDGELADARLIAAAPKLVRALAALLPYAESRAMDMDAFCDNFCTPVDREDRDRYDEAVALSVKASKSVETARALLATLPKSLGCESCGREIQDADVDIGDRLICDVCVEASEPDCRDCGRQCSFELDSEGFHVEGR